MSRALTQDMSALQLANKIFLRRSHAQHALDVCCARIGWLRPLSDAAAAAGHQFSPTLKLGSYNLTGEFATKALSFSQLGKPHLWYSAARSMKRNIIMHVGPTNSGKTHHALERLRTSTSGVYCGPLRLLAWEIFERLNDTGLPCTLVTGQEFERKAGAGHISSTVEMVDIDTPVDVAVLDEIQMIADESRGWAWTRVLLGIPAREIHCCGDPAAVQLVRQLVQSTGDTFAVRTYERLSPLEVANNPIKSLSSVSRGDCIVAFSRRELFDFKQEIEKSTGLRCGVIYGALPPAIRREQARRFNNAPESERTDVLVATDAIGMGLNLAIRRIVFSRLDKFDGSVRRELHVSEMKQIGGRAGRFGSAFAKGEVTGLRGINIAKIRIALAAPSPSLQAAGVLPTLEQLEIFAASLVPDLVSDSSDDEFYDEISEEDQAPLAALSRMRLAVQGEDAIASLVLQEAKFTKGAIAEVSIAAEEACHRVHFSKIFETFLKRVSIDSGDYFLCDFEDLIRIARLLDDTPLPFRARYMFCMCPVDLDEPLCVSALKRYASRFIRGRRVRVGLQLPTKPPKNPTQLRELEAAHSVFDLYLWLSRRFPSVFSELEAAQEGAMVTQNLIQQGLEEMSEQFRLQAARRLKPGKHAHSRKRERGLAVSDYWRSMQDVEETWEDVVDDDPMPRRRKGGKRR